MQESLAKANDVATETFSSMKTVRSFANEDGETERYRKSLEDTYALNKVEAAAYAASTWTNSVSVLLVYWQPLIWLAMPYHKRKDKIVIKYAIEAYLHS